MLDSYENVCTSHTSLIYTPGWVGFRMIAQSTQLSLNFLTSFSLLAFQFKKFMFFIIKLASVRITQCCVVNFELGPSVIIFSSRALIGAARRKISTKWACKWRFYVISDSRGKPEKRLKFFRRYCFTKLVCSSGEWSCALFANGICENSAFSIKMTALNDYIAEKLYCYPRSALWRQEIILLQGRYPSSVGYRNVNRCQCHSQSVALILLI